MNVYIFVCVYHERGTQSIVNYKQVREYAHEVSVWVGRILCDLVVLKRVFL